ncbi:MAG TPA: FAD-binding oxidoreductase [Thermoleophilaceae bacterium]|jgi:glycolate oxidase FAD binding subunit
MTDVLTPGTYEEAAAALREAARVRPRGGGTKLGWGAAAPAPDVELSLAGLDRVVEHNAGDLTAVVQAGVPLARLRGELAAAGQMLAVDPPLGAGDAATVGGVLATADSGPLRHRHGGPRDLVLGVTVALSDGTIARAGGKVIKNVAGYDLAKLFTGSFGTLGAILEAAVRLHPLPPATATAVGESDDPAALAAAVSALAHGSLEAQCLDVSWSEGRGRVLARMAGARAEEQAGAAVGALARAGLEAEAVGGEAEPRGGDPNSGGSAEDRLWAAQRAGQRSASGVVVRVSGVQAQVEAQLRAAERAGGSLVGRAAHGLSWIALEDGAAGDPVAAVEQLRRELAPAPCVVLDAPRRVRERIDPWGAADGPAVELMRRVKARFDPTGSCNAGVFVGGI